jgi:hypothetical protein
MVIAYANKSILNEVVGILATSFLLYIDYEPMKLTRGAN